MTKTYTEKNKKSEILEAYNRLLKDLKERKVKNSKEEQQRKEEEKTIQDTKNLSLEKIIKSLGDVKLEINKNFDSVESNMIEQYKKLNDLQKSIEITKKNLKEVYDIQVNVDSLQALLEGQKRYEMEFEEKKEEEEEFFENEMKYKKYEWEQEKKNYEKDILEYENNKNKEREREEEEYNYNLSLKRKKEKDEYLREKAKQELELKEKKIEFEKNFEIREKAIKERESEYQELLKQVKEFPNKLDASIKSAEKNMKDNLLKEHEYKISFMRKDIDGEKKLYEQKIISLENKIKEQQKLIDQLTDKVNESSNQVQNIAIKAVEGAFPRDRKDVEINEG